MNAKDLWNNLFDISLEKYLTEDCSIRNMAMLLHVFRLEYQKVNNYIKDLQQKNETQSGMIKNYEHELKSCNCKKTERSPLKTLKENRNLSPLKINQSNLSVDHFDDIFNDHISDVDLNISKENDASLFVDDSFSTFARSTSPTLNNKKASRSFRATSRNHNLNNSSVIQGTPTLKVNKVKKFKQSKLPLSFCPSVKNNKNCDDTDSTFCFPDRKVVNDSGTDIDDIIDEIYCASPSSKRTKLLDNSYDRLPVTHDTPKIAIKREAARKKSDRLQMQGWGCQDCEKYYAALNLPEEELKKRMNQCSKHRDNFNPIRLTPEGFWNPDFTPSQNSFAFEL